VDDILLVSNDIDLDLELYQMDIKTVFLNGDIAEEIYTVQPDSFEAKGSLVYKLKKIHLWSKTSFPSVIFEI